MNRNWPFSLLSVCVLLLALAGCQRNEVQVGPRGTLQGQKLAFTLPNLEGKSVSLEEEFSGKPVVLNVFATWCAPCRKEMPEVEKEIWQPLKDKGVAVVGLNANEDAEAVREFVRQQGVSFPVLLDKEGEVTNNLGIQGVPQTILLDRSHQVKEVFLGYNPSEFKRVVKAAKALAEEKR